MIIRQAQLQDAQGITDIYNEAIKPEIYAAAVLAPIKVDNRIAWLESFTAPFGAWVYLDDDDKMLGWASLNPCPLRPGIGNISEISVYIGEGHRSKGIGLKLLAFLVEKARQLGFDALMTITYAKNRPSIDGSIYGGFKLCGTFDNISFRDDVLEDVVWLHKDLSQPDPACLDKPKRLITPFLSE